MERTKKSFNEQGIHVNRVEAVNGWKLSQTDREDLAGPYPIRLNGGQFGCLLSHFSVYTDALQRGFNIIWISEDDIEFVENAQKVADMIKKLSIFDPDWDLFYTDFRSEDPRNSFTGCQDPRPLQEMYSAEYERVGQDLLRIRGRHTTHSMIFSRKGLQKIVDYFTHVYLWTSIDIDIHYVPNIREYSARRNLVTALRNGSSSDTEPASHLNQGPVNETYFFSLAEDCRNTGKFGSALQYYQAKVAVGGLDAEVFWSLYQIAVLQEGLNLDANTIFQSYQEAHQFNPLRAEPLYRLANSYLRQRKFLLGYTTAKQALQLSLPTNTQLAEPWIYDYGLLLTAAHGAFELQKYYEFADMCCKILSVKTLPLDIRKRVENHLNLIPRQQ